MWRVGNYLPPKGGVEIRKELIHLLFEAHHSGAFDPYFCSLSLRKTAPVLQTATVEAGRALWAWQMNRRGGYPLGFFTQFFTTRALSAGR